MEGAVMDSSYAVQEATRKREEAESAAHPVTVNGHSLTLGDLYSSHYDRKEMQTKLKLLDSQPGSGEPDDEPGEGSPGEEKKDVEEQLFGGPKVGKSTAGKMPKSAPETDGEDDMEPLGK